MIQYAFEHTHNILTSLEESVNLINKMRVVESSLIGATVNMENPAAIKRNLDEADSLRNQRMTAVNQLKQVQHKMNEEFDKFIQEYESKDEKTEEDKNEVSKMILTKGKIDKLFYQAFVDVGM